jgi:hypothetical protein
MESKLIALFLVLFTIRIEAALSQTTQPRQTPTINPTKPVNKTPTVTEQSRSAGRNIQTFFKPIYHEAYAQSHPHHSGPTLVLPTRGRTGQYSICQTRQFSGAGL